MKLEDAAVAVAQAVYEALVEEPDEPDFDQLEPEERQGFVLVAEEAMKAHLEFLGAAGYRIAPPGMMLRPKSETDAKAMILAANEYLASHTHAGSPKRFILPPGRGLQ